MCRRVRPAVNTGNTPWVLPCSERSTMQGTFERKILSGQRSLRAVVLTHFKSKHREGNRFRLGRQIVSPSRSFCCSERPNQKVDGPLVSYLVNFSPYMPNSSFTLIP